MTTSAFAWQKQDGTESKTVAVTGDFNGGVKVWDYKDVVSELTMSGRCDENEIEGGAPPSISKRRRLGNHFILVPCLFFFCLLSQIKHITFKCIPRLMSTCCVYLRE